MQMLFNLHTCLTLGTLFTVWAIVISCRAQFIQRCQQAPQLRTRWHQALLLVALTNIGAAITDTIGSNQVIGVVEWATTLVAVWAWHYATQIYQGGAAA